MTNENPYSKLDEKGVTEQVALFKEALEGKSIDLYTSFSLEKPKEITAEDKAKFAGLEENSETLAQIAKILKVDTSKNTDVVEPTPAEKQLLARQEKLEQSAFSDKIAEVKSINSEFDSTGIEGLEIPTSEKVTLMGTVKAIVQTYQSGYDKLKAELTNKDAGVLPTKLSTGSQDASADPDANKAAGKDIVAKFSSKYNYDNGKDK